MIVPNNSNNMKKLSIVTLCIDPHKEIFSRFISSIKQYTENYELIIVDNNGKDKEISKLLEATADKYIKLERQENIGKAWNIGIENSCGDYILVTNDDVVVPRNWFETMSSVFKEYEDTGLVVPVMNYALLEQTHIGDIFHIDEACPIRLTPFSQLMWGAFMLFSKKSLDHVGNFDDSYDIAGGEDLDMCFRMYENKFGIYSDHRVFVYHEWGSTGMRTLGDSARKELYKQNYRKFKAKWSKYTAGW